MKTATKETTTMATNVEILDEAALRLERAERAVAIAGNRVNAQTPQAPMRLKAEAIERWRAADAELRAAQAAYEAAQDLPAPEA